MRGVYGKHIVFFLCVLLPGYGFYAQNRQVDSLKRVVALASADTVKTNALLLWGDLIFEDNPQQALKLYEQARNISEKNSQRKSVRVSDGGFSLNSGSQTADEPLSTLKKKNLLNLATALKGLGNAYGTLQQEDKALEAYNQAIDIFTQLRYAKAVASCYYSCGLMMFEHSKKKEALAYYNKSLALYEEAKDKVGTAKVTGYIALVYDNLGQVQEALRYYALSMKGYEEVNDADGVSIVLTNIANVYMAQGDLEKALLNYHRSLKISEDLKDKRSMGLTLNNIGNVYYYQGQYNEALGYYQQCLNLAKEINDRPGLARSYINVAAIYQYQKKLAPALDYFKKGLKLNEELGDKTGIAIALNNMSEVYTLMGQLDTSLIYATKSLAMIKEADNMEIMTSLYINVCNVYLLKGSYDKALETGLIALKHAKELGYPYLLKNISEKLKIIYQKKNNPVKSLEMYELYVTMRDSLNNEENRKSLYKASIKHEYEKKAVADSIKALDEKKIAEAKLSESQATIRQERTQKLALYAGFVLILIFTGFIYNRFKISQRQKHIIEVQKSFVDESQRKIIASINYARRIQSSMLPAPEEIRHFFDDSLIFFKPKDIVSGDFYWFHHDGPCSYLAVADCTGHGVPGAFMTMIANSILNEVVIEQKITSPDKILDQLHSLVFKALKQHKGDEYSQDGMDIALVKIDHEQRMLHFAGARNHAYLVYNGTVEILKATPKSIGGLSLMGEVEPERKFSMQSMELKAGSLLILCTDGFFDQLSHDDKKFGTNRFKELIAELSQRQSSEDMLSLVETTFEQWKRDTPQLDDVLVVGIRT